jgi:bifunctional non-homologous end joining protein LigD
VRLNEHLEHPEGNVVFFHAYKLGAEGIVSKRLGSRYRSGRSPDWLKFKNPGGGLGQMTTIPWGKYIGKRLGDQP